MIRAIIVDDEQPSVEKLARLLQNSGVVEIKGTFTNAAAAVKAVKNTIVDAVFLDIEMPDMNGMKLSQKIMEIDKNIAVVFITAYSKYAVEAFRLDAMDYLMKPIDKEKVAQTLDRIIEKKDIRIGTESNKIYCFDKFKVMNKDVKVEFRTAKAEELLAFFIHHHGKEIARSEIIDQIWAEFDGDKAIDNFNANLYYMKKALLKHDFIIEVERNKDKYKLLMRSVYCDYFEFMSAISLEDKMSIRTIEKWEQAIRLYQGDYFKGNDYTWAEGRKLFLREKHVQLILSVTNYYNRLNQFEKSIELLKNGLKFEPLYGEFNERLIKKYIILGDQYSAVKHYNEYKKKLKKELGIEPSPNITRIMKKIKETV